MSDGTMDYTRMPRCEVGMRSYPGALRQSGEENEGLDWNRVYGVWGIRKVWEVRKWYLEHMEGLDNMGFPHLVAEIDFLFPRTQFLFCRLSLRTFPGPSWCSPHAQRSLVRSASQLFYNCLAVLIVM